MTTSSIIVLTGATAGIGRATAKALAPTAGKLVLVARNEQKLKALIAELAREADPNNLDYVVADLSEAASIEQAVAEIRSRYDHIDLLVNNAGGFFSDRMETSAGYEYTFALDHLGYYHFTTRLLDLIEAAPKARIVSVSSAAHTMGKMNWDDLMLTKEYGGMKAYGQAKLANILFTKELAERLKDKNITVNCLHPGVVATNFMDNMPAWIKPLAGFAKIFMKSPDKGAETSVYLATSSEVEGITGEYFADKKVAKVSPAAKDRADAQKLWQISEELVEKALVK
ncbi:MAG: SDR family oxidoreductase [Bacteroidia bacterium]|nr:SDR family oxidoreductase [Bacteroidia bacterium]